MSTLKLLQNSLHSLLEIDQRVHIVELLEFFTNLASLFMSSNFPSLKFISEVTHTLVMMTPHCTTTIPSSSSMMALTNFGPEGTRKQTNFSQEFYKFSESVHRFLGRPSLLVEFVRNHGVHSRILTGHRYDCMVCTFFIICSFRFRWRSHQSTDLYFAASSSLRQVDLCTYSTQVSFGRRLTPTISLNILLLLVRRSLSVSAHIVQQDDP